MPPDVSERLERYDLDDLLTLAKREQLIDGHDRQDGALSIDLDHMSIALDEDRALLYLRGLVRAWVLGGGHLPPVPEAAD